MAVNSPIPDEKAIELRAKLRKFRKHTGWSILAISNHADVPKEAISSFIKDGDIGAIWAPRLEAALIEMRGMRPPKLNKVKNFHLPNAEIERRRAETRRKREQWVREQLSKELPGANGRRHPVVLVEDMLA